MNSTQKEIRSRKNGDNDGIELCKLMNSAIFEKATKILKNRIDVRPVNNEKGYSKWTLNPSYMSQKIFVNDLVTIRKSKAALTLNKAAYIGMFILALSKILMFEIHYDYIKNKYNHYSRLCTDTDSLMYKIKTEGVYEDFNSDKEMFDFSNYSTKSK